MLTLIIVSFVLLLAVCHLDKLKYLRYIPQIIWGTIKSIPELLRAAWLFIQGITLVTFGFVLTWGFWPLALWLIFGLDIKTKH